MKADIDARVFDDKSVQVVSMAVPNHWHALSTIWACQAGKDVYSEKPACYNIFEGQQMIAAARKYGRMVQIGSQSRSIDHINQSRTSLYTKESSARFTSRRAFVSKRRPSIGHKEDGPVPAGLDWDKFLGPAPHAPLQ